MTLMTDHDLFSWPEKMSIDREFTVNTKQLHHFLIRRQLYDIK